VREEVTNTNKPRKTTPTQPVTGDSTHISDDLNQPDGQTAIKKIMYNVIDLIHL